MLGRFLVGILDWREFAVLFQFADRLEVKEFGVNTIFIFKQFFMRAGFGDAAVFDDKNFVSVNDSREPVGDDNHGLFSGNLFDGFLDQAFRVGV